ncbi:MAG: hypothetical protein Ct9H300mP15_13820 [Gemmatimonadota bacterium]|nr:MAG: hypothetical protein Ct9H300mP15_13820 [Gemmatimonadota bacterium]
MKKLVLGFTLSAALSFFTFSSSADAQNVPAQGPDSWPSVSDFAAPGPFAIHREANIGPDAAYDIVPGPMQLGEDGRKHPIISWNKGRYTKSIDIKTCLTIGRRTGLSSWAATPTGPAAGGSQGGDRLVGR